MMGLMYIYILKIMEGFYEFACFRNYSLKA